MARLQSLFLALALTACPGRDDLVINTSALPIGTVGQPYQATITGAGGAEEGYVWRLTGGTLPAGLEIAAQGTPSTSVSGTPSEAGTFNFTVAVSDVGGNEAIGSIRIVIDPSDLPQKLEITTASLPNGMLGVPYSATIAASGGSGSGYVFSLGDGALPAGLMLSEVGALFGAPATEGAFPITISVRDSAGNVATKPFDLQIDGEPVPLRILTENLPVAELNAAYTSTLAAEGGTGGYQWSLAEGTLPIGLALSAIGSIDGAPVESGTFDFTVQVEDSSGAADLQELRLVVAGTKLAIATINLPRGVPGIGYSAAVAAAGGSGSGYSWSVSRGSLPDGLALAAAGTPETTISGTPTSTGTFTFTLSVIDDAANGTSQELSIEIVPPVSIETTLLPSGRAGGIYSADITARGGADAGYSWSLVQGSLPSGLTLGSSGVPATAISGSSIDFGTFTFTVRVDEPLGSFDEQELTIELLPMPVEIVTSTLPSGTALSPYAAVITTVNGSMTGYAWSASGALPPGLTLDPTGTPPFTSISGIPTTPGTYTATITVTDGTDSDSQLFTIEIVGPPIAIATTAIPPPLYGSNYSATITAMGGSGSGFIWSVQGDLPRGLTLGASGTPSTTISGYPIAEGAYDFTVEVRDSFGTTGVQRYTGSVARNLTILTRALPTVDAGANYSAGITAAGGSGAGYVWAISRGTAPAGLILGAGGTPSTAIAGVTTAIGVHTFTVRVTDSNGTNAFATFHLQVRAPQTSTLIVGDVTVDNDTEVFVNGLTPASVSPMRISPAGAGTRDASTAFAGAQFSPDHTRAAFMGDFTTDGRISLYVVDLLPTVGAPVDVSGAIVANGNVTGFAWSPDSVQLVFRADKNTDNLFELFWVDMRGGVIPPALRISGTMVAGGGVSVDDYFWSPDSEKVIYHADQNVDEQYELFIVDVESPVPPPALRLNNDMVANGDADDSVLFLPDGDRVIYWSQEQAVINRLYLADITGGGVNARTRLNTRNAIVDRAVLSPDGGRLLYVSDDDIADARELYLIDLTAPAAVPHKVNPDFPSNAQDVASAKWSPDGRRILYAADQDTDNQIELYVVDADGFPAGAPLRINPPFTLATTDVDSNPLDGFGWSPDGTWAAFLADVSADEVFELWIADLSVRPPVASRVSPALAPFADVLDFLFAPDSNRIVYRADQSVEGQEELFYSDLSGATPGAPQQVNTALPAGGDVISGLSELRWSRNSQAIYYRADQAADNLIEAFGVSVTTGSPGAPFRIHGVLPVNGDVNVLNVQQP